MKILRVINKMAYGGAERGVSDVMPIHKKNGFDIDLLLLDGVHHPFKSNLIDKIKIISLGININIYNPLLILKIIPILKSYDLVHVSLFPSFYWVGLSVFFLKNKPKLIFTEHNTTNKRRNKLIFRIMDRIVYGAYDHVVNISKGSHKSFQKYTNYKIKSSIVYNGINFKPLTISNKKISKLDELVLNKKVVLQVSSFRDDKDQQTLIRAISMLPSNYLLLLAGDGKNIKKCKDLADKLNISKKIMFLGNRDDIGSIIKLSDVCVLSSHVEGFGRAAVESMFLKKPTIGSDVEGLREVIGDKKLLFNVGDYIRLSELILELIENKKYREMIIKKSHEKSLQFTYTNMIKSYEKLYKSFS